MTGADSSTTLGMTSDVNPRERSESRDLHPVLTGLFGDGIGASRSPWMHEREADAQGIRLVYSLYDFAALGLSASDLPVMLAAAKRMGFAGVNVTHPYKQAVVPFLDELNDDARRIGAVNTVAFRKGRTIGFNTDAFGFAESMRRSMHDAPRDVVVLIGAGGAGAAVAHALLARGAGRLVLHDRDAERLASLAGALALTFGRERVSITSSLAASLGDADGVVNATPMGMAAHPGLPLPESSLRPALWVADVVYVPPETELLRKARAMGCRTLDGTGMAVFQAAAAFEIFTGRRADVERMLSAFDGPRERAQPAGRP
jgi:shikimate dehydrogenase